MKKQTRNIADGLEHMQKKVQGLAKSLGVELNFTPDKALDGLTKGKLLTLAELEEHAKSRKPVWFVYIESGRDYPRVNKAYFPEKLQSGDYFFSNGTCGACDFEPAEGAKPSDKAELYEGHGNTFIYEAIQKKKPKR